VAKIPEATSYLYNILSLSGVVVLSIHPSSSSPKKKMMEGEEDYDEWRRQQQFMKNSRSLAICQKLQTNFKKLKIVEKKKKTREEIFSNLLI
jgi:predicted nuclease with RNAse H fold